MRFRPGSVVRLKSGGPLMTILRLDEDPLQLATGEPGWVCGWYVQNAPRSEVYPGEALRRCRPAPSAVASVASVTASAPLAQVSHKKGGRG